MSILEVNHIKKVYKTRMGRGRSHRIKGCAFQCGTGRICGDHGRIRKWQDNASEHPCKP